MEYIYMIYICIYVYIYVYIYTYVHIHTYLSMCVYVYTHRQLDWHSTFMQAHGYRQTYIRSRIRAYIHG